MGLVDRVVADLLGKPEPRDWLYYWKLLDPRLDEPADPETDEVDPMPADLPDKVLERLDRQRPFA